jgi:ribosomal protein L14
MAEIIENEINDSSSDVSENEYKNNLAIFDDVTIPYEYFDKILIDLNKINSKINTINLDKQKDMDKVQKKVESLMNIYREMSNNYLTFFNRCVINVRKDIKLEKKKKKQEKDKSKYFVNIPKNAPPFILALMNKKEDEKVSQSQVLQAIIQKIKKNIETSPTTYAVFKENGKIDKTKFKIQGELTEIFENIKEEAKKRGNNIVIPASIGYPNLMSYMQYFIYK